MAQGPILDINIEDEETPVATKNVTINPEGIINSKPNINPQQVASLTDQAVSQVAADKTITSGVSGDAMVNAAQGVKEDVQKSFFQTTAGQNLLSILGGAIGGGLAGGSTIGFGAGATIGGSQGVNLFQQQQKLLGEAAGKEDENLSKLFDRETKLRKEFEDAPVIKDFEIVSNNAENINVAVKDLDLQIAKAKTSGQNPEEVIKRIATDQTVITSFNKILDPTSVVRESEFNRTAASLGVTGKIEGWKEKLRQGGSGITQQDLRDMQRLSNALFAKRKEKVDKHIERFKGLAADAKVKEENVIRSFSGPSTNKIQNFNTVAEAEAANLPKGTIITIQGRKAVVK